MQCRDGATRNAERRSLESCLALSQTERSAEVDPTLGGFLPAALDTLPHGLIIFDRERQFCYANDRYFEIYQLSRPNIAIGTRAHEIWREQARRHTKDPMRIAAYLEDRNREGWCQSSGIRELPDGRSIYVTRTRMANEYTISTHEDITDRVGIEQRITHAARHDALTKLPNRTFFLEQLEAALPRVRRGEQIALHFIDLDRFKTINDTLGHGVGDKLMEAVGARLCATVRETDTVARIGGDEFAVLQLPAPHAEDAEVLAKRLMEEMKKPYIINGKTVFSGISVGIALASKDCDDTAELLQRADFALYRAKNSGRGCYCFFEHELDRQLRNRRRLESEIRSAIVKDQFEIHYQPIINMANRRVETVEALIRWNRNGDWVSPGQFIPVAEETGLILPIGDWVLRQACEDATTMPDHVAVAVNVSPLQFRSGDVVESVDRAVNESGLAPERLEIEVTESLLLDQSGDVLETLEALSARGVIIALDDFGTGYSSLSYLVNFPFSKIKIDRSFVSGLPHATEKLAVLRAMSSLGLNLGLATTIEGIETAEQLEAAGVEKCSEAQGFYFAKPTPLPQIREAVRRAEQIATMEVDNIQQICRIVAL